MATTSPFDPDKVDPDFYSRDPNQHGNSDYGQESAGVSASISNVDLDDAPNASAVGNSTGTTGDKESTTQEWDVNEQVSPRSEAHMMSDEAADKLNSVAENPSDDALLHRADATYLEQGDNPNEGYDPHSKGYDGKDKSEAK